MSLEFEIFVNLFLHYPESINSTVVNEKLTDYFREYFNDNKPLISKFSSTHVIVKSAPHYENQMIIIDVNFKMEVDKSIDKSKFLLDCRDFLFRYFDNQFQEIFLNWHSYGY